MIRLSSAIAVSLALCFASAASAQTAAPAAPAPAATPAAPAAPAGKMSAKPRTAKSIACSGQADQQGLHGKPRKTFMSKCKSGKM